MTTYAQLRYGALAKRTVLPRPRTPSRDDHEYLFSNPVNAARLRQAIDDSRAGRNLTRTSIEELEALLHRESR